MYTKREGILTFGCCHKGWYGSGEGGRRDIRIRQPGPDPSRQPACQPAPFEWNCPRSWNRRLTKPRFPWLQYEIVTSQSLALSEDTLSFFCLLPPWVTVRFQLPASHSSSVPEPGQRQLCLKGINQNTWSSHRNLFKGLMIYFLLIFTSFL